MQCSCIDIDWNGEASTALTQIIRKARKTHKCMECGEAIDKGQTYEYYVGKCDGRIFTHRTCMDCLSLREAFFCSYLFGEVWDGFREEVWNTDGMVCMDAIAKLTPKAREEACAIIEEVWENA